jgi:hypothetical protein
LKIFSLSSPGEERAGVRRPVIFRGFNPLTPTLSPFGGEREKILVRGR